EPVRRHGDPPRSPYTVFRRGGIRSSRPAAPRQRTPPSRPGVACETPPPDARLCLQARTRRGSPMGERKPRLGILCGGGPAPGINSVISAATIEAVNSGWEVIGILDGFEHLIQGSTAHVLPLSITDVSRIHALGGSILYTARANPTVRDEGADDPDWRMHNCLKALRELGIELLVTIGGGDTAFGVAGFAVGRALALADVDVRAAMHEIEVDEHGHIRLGELNLNEVLADRVKARFKARGQKMPVTAKNIGYELR